MIRYIASPWLTRDARNRAARTLAQGLVVVVVLPGLDAALQAAVTAVTAGGHVDWGRTGAVALTAAAGAVLMSATAYVHRLRVDPAGVPSMEPPRPPGVSERQAPATEPAPGPEIRA